MTDFNIGDKVRYVGGDRANPKFIGVEGEVVSSGKYDLTVKITKETEGSKGQSLGNGRTFWPRLGNLIKISDGTAAKEEEEKTFKVGDKVTITGWESNKDSNWEGRTGKVVETFTRRYMIEFEDAKGGWIYQNGTFDVQYLEAVKPFEFTDIKVGDKIKRTRTWPNGTEEIVTGTVNSNGKLTAYSKDDVPLAFEGDDRRDNVTLELLERPEPKPEPKLWENRAKGDKIVREDEEGDLTVFTHEGDDNWSSIYLNNKDSNTVPEKGYGWDKDDIGDALSNYTLTLITA